MDPLKYEKMMAGPALKPPEGVRPQLENPPNLDQWFIVTLVLCLAIPTVLLIIRLYTQVLIIKRRGWEDYTLFLGWLVYVGYCTTTGLIVRYGGGVHQWNVRLRDMIKMAYYINTSAILYGVSVTFIKAAILTQYRTIFSPSKTKGFMFWSTWTLTFTTIIFYGVVTFAEIFECNPRAKAWNPLILEGSCLDRYAIITASGVYNVFIDFVLLILPQHVIWKLQMPLKRKLAISGIFLIGFFACITSILRLYYAIRLQASHDVSYDVVIMGLWTYAEIASCIICVCLPVFPKFYQHFRPRAEGSSWGSSGPTYVASASRSWNTRRKGSRTQDSSSFRELSGARHGSYPSLDGTTSYEPKQNGWTAISQTGSNNI